MGCERGQHALREAAAALAVGAEAALSPEYRRTDGALRRVVGRLHAPFVRKGPQRRGEFQDALEDPALIEKILAHLEQKHPPALRGRVPQERAPPAFH